MVNYHVSNQGQSSTTTCMRGLVADLSTSWMSSRSRSRTNSSGSFCRADQRGCEGLLDYCSPWRCKLYLSAAHHLLRCPRTPDGIADGKTSTDAERAHYSQSCFQASENSIGRHDPYKFVEKPGMLPGCCYETMFKDMISPWDITRPKPGARAKPKMPPSCTALSSKASKNNAR